MIANPDYIYPGVSALFGTILEGYGYNLGQKG